MISEKKSPRNTLLPLVLIAVGVLVFIANLGGLNWGVLLGVLQLWPLALIAVGADILSRGRYRAAIFLATFVVGAVFYMGAVPFGTQAARVETVDQALGGAQRANIFISTGVSELRLRASSRAGILAQGEVQARRGERIVQNVTEKGGTTTFELTSEQARSGFFSFGSGTHLWDLAVTNEVPVDLRIDTGVGRANLDLSEANLSNLSVDTGVGAVVLTLPERGGYQASLDTGVGAATLRIPAELATRVVVDRGVGSVAMPSTFERDGDTYTSPGYATAEQRVEVRVSSGVGAVTVETGF